MTTRLPAELRKSVETLNDLTNEQVEEARRLANTQKILAASYLGDLVVKCNLGWAADFIDQVLCGSADVSTWGFDDRLYVPDLEWDELVTQPLTLSLAVLDKIEGDRQVRSPPLARWAYSRHCGGPGVLVKSKPYWWTVPSGVLGLMKPGDVEPITNLEIAGRRWIASRVAWKWKFTGRPMPATVEEVAAVLELKAPMSRDGEMAVSGLIREQGMTGREEMAPGFRGPDEWFAKS